MAVAMNGCFDRHYGLIDLKLMQQQTLVCVGTGGISGAIYDVAALGVGRMILVDPGVVEAPNIGTSAFNTEDIVKSKVSAIQRHVQQINSSCAVTALQRRDDELHDLEIESIWEGATISWSMTDDPMSHARCNALAVKYGKDTIFGAVHADSRAWDVIGTLPTEIAQGAGCYRCYARSRLQSHEHGREHPAFFPSHRLIAGVINQAILWITVGLIHYRAGSTLSIARYGEAFAGNPCIIGLLDLDHWVDEGDPFGDVALGQRMFATRLVERPRYANWTCPDCGTSG
jgi:hypothetical protein